MHQLNAMMTKKQADWMTAILSFFAKRSIKFSKNECKFSRQTSDNSLKYYLIISFCLSGAISLQQPKSRFFLNSTKEVSLCWYARVNSVVIRFENFVISDRYNPTTIFKNEGTNLSVHTVVPEHAVHIFAPNGSYCSFNARAKPHLQLWIQFRAKPAELSQAFITTLEREKELLKRNSALENQLKESHEKMDDLRIQHKKENESLQTEIQDLKDTLLRREKCHTRQKDIFKKMAANAQRELDKARAVISNLSEGMKACEATLFASKETISEKDQKIKQLTSQLNRYEDLIRNLTIDMRNYHKSLQKAANDVDKMSERLEVSLAVKKKLLRKNRCLEEKVVIMEETMTNAEAKVKELSEVNSKLVEKISFLQDEDKKMQFDLQERRNKERLNDKMGMMNHLKEDLKTKRTDVTVEILAGVYDGLQPTELNVKSGDCFLPEQKSTVLIKETETPKGDEANIKKTVKVKENSEPRPSMLSSAARVSTSGTLVQDTCLRKRHRSDQSKGFSYDSKTADPLSMPTAGGPIRHHQSPLPPIFARLSTSEVGRAKKDDDWLVRKQGNFLPFSPKGK
ncbi:unnamed protein product [Pocillopora meandrina]|uniref:Uncharacterized protein n=1 Tax=Pocillopora meandrina TaxID=46732 RepID=A0AAU9VLI2_9CNID|nr:unnamed protein product [Pocillopora meandrina]